MATENIQLKNGNRDLLFPKTNAAAVMFDKAASDIGDGDVQSAIDDLSKETIGISRVEWQDQSYATRGSYAGQNQNCHINKSNPLQMSYNTGYSVHFFPIEGGDEFRFTGLATTGTSTGSAVMKFAFYTDYVSTLVGKSNGGTMSGTTFISGMTGYQMAQAGMSQQDFTVKAPDNARMLVVTTSQTNSQKFIPTGLANYFKKITIPPISMTDKIGMEIGGWDLMLCRNAGLNVGDTMPQWDKTTGTRGVRVSVKAGQVLLVDLKAGVKPLTFTDENRIITAIYDSPVKGAFVAPNDGYAYLQNLLTNDSDSYIYNAPVGGIAEFVEEIRRIHNVDIEGLSETIYNVLAHVDNDIQPLVSSWSNPLVTTNKDHRDVVLEAYVPSATEGSEYKLRFGRNYTQLTVALLQNDTQIGYLSVSIQSSASSPMHGGNVDGVLNKLMSGADVVGYVILKYTDFLVERLNSSISSTNLFTTDAMNVAHIRDLSCSPSIGAKLGGGSSSGASSPWNDKVLALYGDSVSSGSDAVKPYTVSGTDWGVRVADFLGAARIYNRSMPGTSNKNQGGGGRVCGVNSVGHQNFNGYTGNVNVTWDAYKADPSSVSPPSGSTIVPSAGCFWQRIIKSFPESIKDTIDVVMIFFHNDGSSSANASWVAGSTVDAEWAASSYYSAYGGDFNINETTGGLYSTIMKMQAWMPQALIVLCTPWSGAGNDTSLSPSTIAIPYSAMADNVRVCAKNNAVPLIDVNATDGVNPRNRSLYARDGIHPNEEGTKMIAMAFCGAMLGIVPKF